MDVAGEFSFYDGYMAGILTWATEGKFETGYLAPVKE